MSLVNRRRIYYLRGADRQRAGMTLVEVIVVIAIILIITSVLAFGIFTVFGQAKADTAKLEMARIESRIQIYMARHGRPPEGGIGDVVAPDPVPTDPWGNEYRLVTPGPNGKQYDLVSLGADGVEGGEGENADIRLSELGS